MPYKLTWEPSGIYRQYSGDVSIAERRASFDEICGDSRFDDLRYAITDYLTVREYEVGTGAMTPNPSLTRTRTGIRRMALISFWARRGLPVRAA